MSQETEAEVRRRIQEHLEGQVRAKVGEWLAFIHGPSNRVLVEWCVVTAWLEPEEAEDDDCSRIHVAESPGLMRHRLEGLLSTAQAVLEEEEIRHFLHRTGWDEEDDGSADS